VKTRLAYFRGQAPFLVAAALIGYGAVLFAHPFLNDPDTYWHIKAGQWILHNGAVPHADPFSYTFAGAPWVAHEWLSEALMALAYGLGAWNGVVIFFGIVTALTFWLLASRLSLHLKQPASLIAFLLAAACIAPSLLARPHLLSLPILVLWLGGLLAAREKGAAPPAWLLPLMALWANLHGSFAFGLALVPPIALETLMEAQATRGRLARAWGLFLAAAIGMSLLTPNGWHGLLFPLQLVGVKHISNISEWAPLDFHTLQPLELALMATLYITFTRPVRLAIPRLLTLIALLHFALHQSRHQMLAGIVGAMLLAEPLGRALGGNSSESRSAPSPRAWLVSGAAIAVLLTAMRLMHPIVRGDDRASPITALDHVPMEIRREAVLNSYEFGGYLIFSDVKPFIDGRADMYGDDFVLNYLSAMTSDQPALQRLVEKYGIQWAILGVASPASDMLGALPHWRRLYADRIAVVYVRDGQ